jgi:hypothetical protein
MIKLPFVSYPNTASRIRVIGRCIVCIQSAGEKLERSLIPPPKKTGLISPGLQLKNTGSLPV